ncbi:MAG: bifunctional folylpolyglutamate synthase/dihydrofolate synthase [Dehalococcoidia bacterium]
MNYAQALQKLLSLTDYERLASTPHQPIRYDLRRVVALLEMLGNPHQGIPAVHIAGTKGKGSTAALCASVLLAQGYPTGLYTSPHLHSFRERIRLDGEPLSEAAFAALLEEVWPAMEQVNRREHSGAITVFELLTAMAFRSFQQRGCRFQVLEVGMGGRLDATNVVSPEVSIITPISLDHTAMLGDTLEQIAQEKAGIIKDGVPTVVAPQPPEVMQLIEEVCQTHASPLVKLGHDVTWRRERVGLEGQSFHVTGQEGHYQLWIPLLGDFQVENGALAVAALEVLRQRGFAIGSKALAQGLRQVQWPCRMEVLRHRPLVIADGAHNPASVARLRTALERDFRFHRAFLVIGVSADKSLESMVWELAQLCPRVWAVRSRHPRAAEPSLMTELFRRYGLEASAVGEVRQALEEALAEAQEEDLVLVTGSLFVAAEAREVLRGIAPEVYPKLQRPEAVKQPIL